MSLSHRIILTHIRFSCLACTYPERYSSKTHIFRCRCRWWSPITKLIRVYGYLTSTHGWWKCKFKWLTLSREAKLLANRSFFYLWVRVSLSFVLSIFISFLRNSYWTLSKRLPHAFYLLNSYRGTNCKVISSHHWLSNRYLLLKIATASRMIHYMHEICHLILSCAHTLVCQLRRYLWKYSWHELFFCRFQSFICILWLKWGSLPFVNHFQSPQQT